ncbi:MAG: hypothetical protein ACRDZ3_09115 [Acidimicrobiia bacterium]
MRPGPRHDRDAGGPAGILEEEAALREEVWAALAQARVALLRRLRAERRSGS